ncbi:MAG: hypothetical protein JOZ19_03745, partial [Rubrobacter sp.]|nr:hypothetical protein [Rubrobacter sp.]
DLTFYLRLSPEERVRRAYKSGVPLDRIEKVGDDFVRRVEKGFETIARSEPNRVKTLDASLSPERLAENVGREILRLRSADGDF